MKRGQTALGALLLVTCAKVEPEPVPAPAPADSDGAEIRTRCTEKTWTADSIRAVAFEALEDEGFGPTAYAGVRGSLPLFPVGWPTSTCAVVVYLYYAEEPRRVPHWEYDPQSNGDCSPLLASATIDLKSSSVEVEVLDYSESPLKADWVRFGKRWRPTATYEIVRQAERHLIEAVVARESVSGPHIFDAYGCAWQSYPQYLDLVPQAHRGFIDEMLRVRPVDRPKYRGGWHPVQRPEEL